MGKVVRRGAAVRQQALNILRNGGTLDDAARITGYDRNYVRQLGAKEGIRFPRYKYGHGHRSKYDSDVIVRMYKDGKSPKEIAEALNVKSITSVYRILNANGGLHKGKDIVAYVMRICKGCNTVFLVHPNHNKIFCSIECQKKESHSRRDIVGRASKASAVVDSDITLKKVAERDGQTCYLCGLPVNWNDYYYSRNNKKIVQKMYPSIDHVTALYNGGKHSWDNVRLAHLGCNSSKGVKVVG